MMKFLFMNFMKALMKAQGESKKASNPQRRRLAKKKARDERKKKRKDKHGK